MIREGLSRHNIVGAYDDMASARKAIEALQFAGIEADDISLRGPAAEEAERRIEKETQPVDQSMIGRIVLLAIVGGAIGAVAGAVLGSILWAADVGIARATDNAGLQIGMWVLAGAIIGSLIAPYWGFTASRAWELTHEPVPGRVFVGVHSDDPDEIANADKVLHKQHAAEITRLDDQGRPETG